jgi:ribosomal protein S18 acetylase RimI-like enzyme
MRHGEENSIRVLLAKLGYEYEIYWYKQVKPLEEHLRKYVETKVSEKIESKNVIFVAVEDSKIVGFCWCSISDSGIDKQGEIAEFYVGKDYKGRRIGQNLLRAAKQLFISEKVEVGFVWTHKAINQQ